MPRLDRRARVASIALLAIAACRSGPPPPDHSDLDAAAARAFVRDQALAVHDLASQVSLSVTTADFSGSLEGALVLAPPDRLRLRATKLMQDIFDLVVSPQGLELYWFPDRILFRKSPPPLDGATRPAANAAATAPSPSSAAGAASDGAPDAGRAAAFLRTLDPGALRASLRAFELPLVDGAPAPPWQMRVVHETVERTAAALTIVSQLEDGTRLTRRFDGASLLLERADVDAADGRPLLRTSYDDYRPVGASWLPRSVRLEDRRFDVDFEMSFEDPAVNEGILPGTFELAPPAGTEVRELR